MLAGKKFFLAFNLLALQLSAKSASVMEDAPQTQQFGGVLEFPITREINNEYHLWLTAKNTAALREGQKAIIRAQAEAAELNLRGMGEIARRQDAANKFLSNLDDRSAELVEEARNLAGHLAHIGDAVVEGIERLDATLTGGFFAVALGIERVVVALDDQHQTLKQIANSLDIPNETAIQEFMRKGQFWLEAGASCEGRERTDNWRDALGLFHEVINNKIGAMNYVAWFNRGWLEWKLENAPGKAEGSFYHAQRLSAPQGKLWHTKCLRHQAEMQYLEGRFEDAWGTANRAIAVQREYETLYNAARYAAKTGRRDQQESLLDECISLRPHTIVTMFAEDDFLG